MGKKQDLQNKYEIGKLPPQAVELEEAVLGACLIEADAVSVVIDILTTDCFYKEQNGMVFSAILHLYKKSQPIDILTVTQRLKSEGQLELVGGAYYVSSLTNRIASSANIEFHARIVMQHFLKRELIRIGIESIKEAYDEQTDVFDVYRNNVQHLEQTLTSIMKYDVRNIAQIHNDLLVESIKVVQSGEKSGVPTGFRNLDNFTNGWQKSDLIIIAGRPGMGKALINSSLVYTPSGSIKIGNAKVGQKILGSDGGVYNITGVHPQGKKEVYRVHFDDKTFVDCCEEHLWEVSTRKQRKNNRKNTLVTTLTTKEMFPNVMVGECRGNYSVKMTKPLNFKHKQTTLHPYLLGVILGDGYCAPTKISISVSEEDLIEKIGCLLPQGDKFIMDKSLSNMTISKKTIGIARSYTWKAIEELGLTTKKSYQKFIPKEYLYNSVEKRTQLLQGLVDTDGHVETKGRCAIRYTTTSHQLCLDVVELVRGLGGKATYVKKQGTYTKNGKKTIVRDCYGVYMSLPNEIIPVSSKKHFRKYANNRRFNHKFITKIENLGYKKDMTCITVNAPDSLFITDGHNLTHNSVCGLAFALNPAISENIPTAIFSLEMSKEQVVGRAQSNLSGIDSSKIIKKLLTMEDIALIDSRCQDLNKAPIYIDDTPALSVMELKGKARKLVRDKGVRLIVVDYLQLMVADVGKGNREQEISKISMGLKALAKELNVPIIALAQLSRAVEARGGDKKPLLSDLRESGSIEQDADMVLFTYRPEYYTISSYELNGETMDTEGLMCLIVAKHRAGSLGELRFGFNGELTKLENYDTYMENKRNGTNSYAQPTNNTPPTQMAENSSFLSESPAKEQPTNYSAIGNPFDDEPVF